MTYSSTSKKTRLKPCFLGRFQLASQAIQFKAIAPLAIQICHARAPLLATCMCCINRKSRFSANGRILDKVSRHFNPFQSRAGTIAARHHYSITSAHPSGCPAILQTVTFCPYRFALSLFTLLVKHSYNRLQFSFA